MKLTIKKLFVLIFIFGLVSLFGDLIYEGARSINAQYLSFFDASASIIGFFFGLSEFISNFLRFIFGFISDKTKFYWLFIILGYFLLIFVPLLALANNLQIAILFILFERIGKAIRSPARDTIVSFISKKLKSIGYSFGIIEFLDQIGALIGPILIGLILLFVINNEIEKYKTAYFTLIIPFFVLIFLLFFAYISFKGIKIKFKRIQKNEKIPKIFWFYIVFILLTVLGFINFGILGYHFKLNQIIPDYSIVFLYSLAMISDAIIALIIGKVYDTIKEIKNKIILLFLIPILSIFIPFLVFNNNLNLIVLAIILFGVVLGMQETLMRALVAEISPLSKRGFAYGFFSFVFGISAFIGSSVIGFLYEISLEILSIFIIFSQISSLLVLIFIRKKIQKMI